MQNVSNEWADLLTAQHNKQFRAIIVGNEYTFDDIISARITQKSFENVSIGNATSAMLEMTFFPRGTIPKQAKIQLEVSLSGGTGGGSVVYIVDQDRNIIQTDDGYTLVGERPAVLDWLPFGTFYIDTRQQDSFTGLMTITAYDRMAFADEPYNDQSGGYPMSMANAVFVIASQLGISVDDRNSIHIGFIDSPNGLYTIREVLQFIGAASGGNWIISPEEKLRLVPLSRPVVPPAPTPAASFSQLGESNVITRVTLYPDSDTQYTAGVDGFEVSGDSVYASQAAASSAYSKLYGVTYTPFVAQQALIDPAIEIGDSATIDGYTMVIYSIVWDISPAMFAEISAPAVGDVEHEIPLVARTREQRITATSISEIRKTTDNIALEVQGKIDEEEAQSIIDVSLGKITLKATAGTNSSTITILSDGIEVDSQVVRFSYIEADKILAQNITGNIKAEQIDLYGDMIVWQTEQATSGGGFIGYAQGLSGGYGIHMMDSSEQSELIATNAGARMTYDNGARHADIYTGSYGVTFETNASMVELTDTAFFSVDPLPLGYSSYPWSAVYAQTGQIITSDREKKTDIQYDLSGYGSLLERLKPASYRLSDGQSNRKHLGFIAQDVEEALAECDISSQNFGAFVKAPREDGGHDYALRYEEFIALVVMELQKQREKIKELEFAVNKFQGGE